MDLAKETENLLEGVKENWDALQALFVAPSNSWDIISTPIGDLNWLNPNILFLFTTQNPEEYEGRQTQIGITKKR